MAAAEEIRKRLEFLRAEMKHAGIDFYLMRSTDPHVSEYIGEYYRSTEYMTGCTSDNVTLIVDETEAYLWTDGRYFISAAGELEGSGIRLMKLGQPGVPTPAEFLKNSLVKGSVLGFDGTCVSAAEGMKLRKIAGKAGAATETREDLASRIWIDRPQLPCSLVQTLPDELCGRTCEEKLELVRQEVREAGAVHLLLSSLDDIMWVLNIRGSDVPCNPVALSFLLIGEQTADLFIQNNAVSEPFKEYARDHRIKLHDYTEILNYLRNYHFDGPIMCDPSSTNDALFDLLKEKEEIVAAPNPTSALKAVKNETEIKNIREFYLKDSVVLCRFIRFIKENAGSIAMTEWEAAEKLDSMRAEIPGFLSLSFPTISAYGPNAAMAHYAPSQKASAEIRPEGFLLVDSGGQYLGATTDVTRTIAVGPLSAEMKRDFTLVAVSNLALLNAVYAKGTTGCQLDLIAREPLYRYRMDFNHGTGHGIGYILNVHEGPQRIAHTPKDHIDAEMQPGMLTSDEPGIYREGQYGIRTETIMLSVPDTENEFGTFYRFEPLTFAPIDLDAVDPVYLDPAAAAELDAYHQLVREKVGPYLEGEDLEWLLKATRPIS